MMPSTDGPDAESKPGETLPQATVAYTGSKHELPPVFGRYRVQKLLGGGGMGAVYLVVNTELEREEALKAPHFDAADDPQVHERFLREAKAAAGLDHPNLCPVYDVGVCDGIYYLTMRYLKGKLLSEYDGTAQPPRKAVEIVTKLAQALAAAHAKGVIHRDLKPNNIMMCAGVGPVVMDFGLAKQTGRQDKALTQMGMKLGTPSYMPPEQVKGDLDRVGPASDVYSLGVVLFKLLTGRLPFTGGNVAEVYDKILHTEAPAPSSLRPGLSATLDAICAKAMAKAPENRYASMKGFAAALIEYLKAPPPPVVVGKGRGGRSRRKMIGWTLGVLLMLGGVGVVVAFSWMNLAHPSAPNTPPLKPSPDQPTHPDGASLDDTITNTIGMKLKLIKAGKFKMGSPDSDKDASDNEKPQHEVEITRPFYMGVYPVTKAQFAAFVSGADYKTQAEQAGGKETWRDPGFVQTDDDPVVYVSWNDAAKFCAWLSQKEKKSYGLPTEAQWEYACRAGTTTAYAFGDDPKMLGDYTWFGGNSEHHSHPVGGKKPNPWGLYDMNGNVVQWCADYYDGKYYNNSPNKDPQNILKNNLCVQRGGSWNHSAVDCRGASRHERPAGHRSHNLGLRVCIRQD